MEDLLSLAGAGYAVLGVFIGFLSGYLGIGGGAALVPALMLAGFDIKYAIGVSIMQMVFSSIFGSFINLKSKLIDVKPALALGLGGFCGATASGFIVSHFSSKFLLGVLLAVQIFNFIKLFKTPSEPAGAPNESKIILFFLGLVVGAVAISVGIGGSVLIMPVLISFLNYDIKKAVGTGLFFVIFSSSSGFISLAMHGFVNYGVGVMVGLGSLAGVYLGIQVLQKTGKRSQKFWLMALIGTIICVTTNKFFSM